MIYPHDIEMLGWCPLGSALSQWGCRYKFSGCTVLPGSKETEHGRSNQSVFPSASKNTGVVLVPCCAWKCVLTAIFWCCVYFWGPWMSVCYGRCVHSEGRQNYFKDWCHMYSQPTFLFLTYFYLVTLWIMHDGDQR